MRMNISDEVSRENSQSRCCLTKFYGKLEAKLGENRLGVTDFLGLLSLNVKEKMVETVHQKETTHLDC